MKEKIRLTKTIHALKSRACLTKRELLTIYKTPLILEQLMFLNSKDVKSLVFKSSHNYSMNYKDYRKLTEEHKEKLCKYLELSRQELEVIINNDIKTQRNERNKH